MLYKMKKTLFSLCFLILGLAVCPMLASANDVPKTGEEALALLKKNNAIYEKSIQNKGDVSITRRQDTAANGQHPYAIILSCADSRVPPEAIFNAGIGDIFVMRNAGNVISMPVLGSMEYGIAKLGVKLVVVLGHTKCGAVDAAFNYKKHEQEVPTSLLKLVQDIHNSVNKAKDARDAEIVNVNHALKQIKQDSALQKLIQENNVVVKGAIYNISTGVVEFL